MKQPIWTPSRERAEASHLHGFLQRMKAKHDFPGQDYQALHRWSVERLEDFWGEVWRDAEVIAGAQPTAILAERAMPADRTLPREVWFPGARFNFAEHLLRRRDDHPAIIAEAEEKPRQVVSFKELYALVARCQAGLKKLGVGEGDRVAALLPNTVEPVVAMLATAALGALWSSTSPDFGFQGVMDRFGQIAPKVLFCTDGYRYNGKAHQTLDKAARIAREIPSIEQVVMVPFLGQGGPLPPGSIQWEGLLGDQSAAPAQVEFGQYPFDQPLIVAYSSGTTGAPKCILHGAGGALVKHHVEQKFHADLGPSDTLFYFSTCGWMMWNWLVSGLAQGATIVAYDGSPVHPDGERLFRLAEENGVTIMGTSPKFLAGCQKAGLAPAEKFDLSRLRTILSTGAPLEPNQFHYVHEAIKADVHVASIAGGTDIFGCFMGGVPTLPVHAGEIQGASLGVDLAAFGDAGEPLIGEKGELVCRNPLPSMPLGFWRDPGMEKYRGAYFERFPGVWHHGDFIAIDRQGGVVVYGRSDATLNPGGVRIGTAEIYRIVEELPFVTDSLVVGQPHQGDVRVVLFVVLPRGLALDAAMERQIREAVRQGATPRHVPAVIRQVSEVPVTINGKKVELAVGSMLRGEPVKNRDALANPDALSQFENLAL